MKAFQDEYSLSKMILFFFFFNCQKVKVYQKEVSDLKASIQLLEEENISLVTKLIDSRLQNLRVPR